ncbi:DarT ssDNA thymidine ADP-ribosyltransferase family protein [Aliivibrio salmonicida]
MNWELMNQRDYGDDEGRSVCMAECLSPNPVPATNITQIYVATQENKESVESILRDYQLSPHVNLNAAMFPKRGSRD